ncbi:MAG: OmpH family outer membrane protein [Candidatus Poribacteria bacterium]|nr:OmpH family outer membrane protein [Candidatus Poribacteria bacterium]
MKKLLIVILPLMLFGVLSGSIGQEAFKIGVVDTQRVLLNYSKAIEVDSQLKAAEKRWKEKLADIGEQISTLQEKKEKTELFVEEAQTADLVNQIQQLQQQYQQEFNQGREALLEKNQEWMTPIFKELQDLIIKIGKEENYDLIIDKQAVFYMNEKYDMSEKLIKLINADAEKGDAAEQKQDAEEPPKENNDGQ